MLARTCLIYYITHPHTFAHCIVSGIVPVVSTFRVVVVVVTTLFKNSRHHHHGNITENKCINTDLIKGPENLTKHIKKLDGITRINTCTEIVFLCKIHYQ